MAKAQSSSKKAQSAAYTQRYTKNRERKLKRALKRNPENTQIQEALKNIHYRRKDPKSPQWSRKNKAIAQLLKWVTGAMDANCFNSNPLVASQTTSSLGRNLPKLASLGRVSFTLGARAHNSDGTPTWR